MNSKQNINRNQQTHVKKDYGLNSYKPSKEQKGEKPRDKSDVQTDKKPSSAK